MRRDKGTVVETDGGSSARSIARREKYPVIAGVLIVLLIVDMVKLHLLHRLLGGDSGGVAAVLLVIAIAYARWRIKRRRSSDD
jgi:hypothetical protein